MIQNTELGPPSSDFAEVKLDPVANRRNLETLLVQKYGQRKPDSDDLHTWHDALIWFDDLAQEYIAPRSKKGNFPKYILDILDRTGVKSNIFVAYLARLSNGSLTDFFLNKYTAEGALPKIAEASSVGKFYFHPNYHLL